jgi:hypothetical protein
MGMFKDAKQSAQNAMQMGAGAQMPPGMPDMANMSMPDPAYVAKVNKIGQSGVEAPGDLKAIRPMGSPDMSGAILHEFDVTVRPASGEPYDTTIQQSMLPMQMEGLSEGKAITVKYDPDKPTDALLHSW